MSKTEQTIHLGLLICAVSVAVPVFGPGRRHASSARETPRRATPLSIVPPGSAFLLRADLSQLRRSAIGQMLARRLGELGSFGDLRNQCGADPLARLDQVVISVPSAAQAAPDQAEDFGIVASGRFSAPEIMRCAKAAISERGGEPVQTKLGSFASIRDRAGRGGEVAVNDQGLLIVSGGSYFRALLDAAEGNAPRPSASDESMAKHTELARGLGRGAVLLTWLLGEHWFERVTGVASDSRLSPLASVKAVAARIDTNRALHASVVLQCADGEGAQRVVSLLGELRSSLGTLPLNLALSRLAQRVAIESHESRLQLDLELEQAELTMLLDLLPGP